MNIALLRVVAQRLAGPRPDRPAAVVAHLAALQGQDLTGAVRSVALRTDPVRGDLTAREAAVRAALTEGEVVRSWPMRGTLHLVPAWDLHWMHPATPDLLEDHRREAEAVMLLPGFDELLLGYADRTATLPARWADAVVPGRNGMFKATVVHRGTAVGTWARARGGSVEATPFTRFTREQEAGIARLSAGD